jgi:hypothetical protein
MSVEAWIAVAIAILSPAVSWIIHSRMFEAKTSEWRQSVAERLQSIENSLKQTDLASFRAMDERREMDWAHWRDAVDQQLVSIVKAFGDWRHNEYAPQARQQSHAISTIQEQISGLKERSDRLERRVFNGSRSD